MLDISIFIRYWLLFELINWFIYLIIYINILTPRYLYLKNKDTEKIVTRLDKLSKSELEYVIKSCIIYNKDTHRDIGDIKEIDINNIIIDEITNIIGYSLFGIEISEIKTHSKFNEIMGIVKNIEKMLEINFKTELKDKYLYRRWGSDFIKFSFRPLFLQIPIRSLINFFHYYLTLKLNFKYHVCNETKISYLYKIDDPNKKTLIYIHGFGLGYIPYHKIILELEKKYNIILIVLPNLSAYRFYDEITYIYFPSLSNIKESIYTFLNKSKISDCVLLSHSFGTYIARILEQDSRSIIFSKNIMIDPIIFWIGCFKMSLYISNPLIKKKSYIEYYIDILIKFIIYECIYHKYVCYRAMFGPDFWIYNSKELVNSKLTMIFEKGDYIIPAELIYNKVKDKIKCHYIDDINAVHGSILIESKYMKEAIDIIDN